MNDAVFQVPRLTDSKVIAIFRRLQAELQFSEPSLQLTVSSTNVPLSSGIVEESSDADSSFIKSVSSSLQVNSPHQNGHITISFQRGKPVASQNGSISFEPSIFFDGIRVNHSGPIDQELAVKVSRFIDREISKNIDSSEISILNPNVKDMFENHSHIIKLAHEQIIQVGNKFAEKRIELEEEFSNRVKLLNEGMREKEVVLNNSFATERDALKAQKAELESRAKTLDDRDNTHVRRGIRKDIKDQIKSFKEKFSLTQETNRLRSTTRLAVYGALGVCLSGISIFSWTSFSTTDTFTVISAALKAVTLTVFAAGLFAWYLRWETRWSDRHADAEFTLHQLELDMDRASWIVETAFEWKVSQNSPIPPTLLESLSRNLFKVGTETRERDSSALDDLASALLGEASRARLKIGENEFEYSRKDLARLSRTESRSASE
ncbi:hypothetical protein [Elioraea sp.]|uniref:hypothetical protein n=1 Tax=Elioraea sp. TaxID=2185103 RepID=UPI0025BB31EB|nr:hypothetical protein [Elioraea sp.]